MGTANIRKGHDAIDLAPGGGFNSHTHDDHVRQWQSLFLWVCMDTDFTMKNAKGSREDGAGGNATDQLCGDLPKGFQPKNVCRQNRENLQFSFLTVQGNLGGELWSSSTTGHTPDAISSARRANGLLLRAAT